MSKQHLFSLLGTALRVLDLYHKLFYATLTTAEAFSGFLNEKEMLTISKMFFTIIVHTTLFQRRALCKVILLVILK